MDKRQITNYVNLAALVSYILGRILHLNFLSAFGLTIMAGLSIWTIMSTLSHSTRLSANNYLKPLTRPLVQANSALI